MNSATGWWFGSKATGTLPQMINNSPGGSQALAAVLPVGSLPITPRGNFLLADLYANDIMALNLTGTPLTDNASSVPAFAFEWGA